LTKKQHNEKNIFINDHKGPAIAMGAKRATWLGSWIGRGLAGRGNSVGNYLLQKAAISNNENSGMCA